MSKRASGRAAMATAAMPTVAAPLERTRPFQSAAIASYPPSTASLTSSSAPMASGAAISIMLLLLVALVIIVLLCRCFRLFPFHSSRDKRAKDEDIERPLFPGNLDHSLRGKYDGNFQESVSIIHDNLVSTTLGSSVDQRVESADNCVNPGDSSAIDVVSAATDVYQGGQTIKRTSVFSRQVDNAKPFKKQDIIHEEIFFGKDGGYMPFSAEDSSLRSCLSLEVIRGPSCGLQCSRQSTNVSRLPLTIGRVPPSDFLLNDSEVSGKHALINWNTSNLKWELQDMGSLNGTFLNSRAIHRANLGSRLYGEPAELENGAVITLGTSSQLSVHISQQFDQMVLNGIGMASAPMATRRGGKELPMEDMVFCESSFAGSQQFGLFCIFDGHGGAEAAKAACKILPNAIANILSNPEKRETIISLRDASDVLRNAFSTTEAEINHEYEGCTATVLLIWVDCNKDIFAQCANVGDSACFVSVNGKEMSMSEDHRVTSLVERTRLGKMGKPVNDGDRRLYGFNLLRMLGDKFIKEQDERFSSEPYVSQVLHITKECKAFALLASDGLWDVMSIKQVQQLILKEALDVRDANSAKKIADALLRTAWNLRTKDNTSIIFLDFDTLRMSPCYVSS